MLTCCVALQEERGKLMQQLQELQALVEQQGTELQQYADNDPEALKQLVDATQVRRHGWVRGRVGGSVRGGSTTSTG